MNVTQEAPIGLEKTALENTMAAIPVGLANYTEFQRRGLNIIHTQIKTELTNMPLLFGNGCQFNPNQ